MSFTMTLAHVVLETALRAHVREKDATKFFVQPCPSRAHEGHVGVFLENTVHQ